MRKTYSVCEAGRTPEQERDGRYYDIAGFREALVAARRLAAAHRKPHAVFHRAEDGRWSRVGLAHPQAHGAMGER